LSIKHSPVGVGWQPPKPFGDEQADYSGDEGQADTKCYIDNWVTATDIVSEVPDHTQKDGNRQNRTEFLRRKLLENHIVMWRCHQEVCSCRLAGQRRPDVAHLRGLARGDLILDVIRGDTSVAGRVTPRKRFLG
jgi:hypothetical protein